MARAGAHPGLLPPEGRGKCLRGGDRERGGKARDAGGGKSRIQGKINLGNQGEVKLGIQGEENLMQGEVIL